MLGEFNLSYPIFLAGEFDVEEFNDTIR